MKTWAVLGEGNIPQLVTTGQGAEGKGFVP